MNVKSVLLVRLDGLGDAIVCVPALEGLRRAYPGARFGAVCSPKNAGLFSNRVAKTYVVGGVTRLAEIVPQISADDYDCALVATEEVAGYRIARQSRVRRRVGFWHRLDKPFKSLWQRAQLTDPVYRPAAWIKRPEHEVESLYRLAQVLGAPPPPPQDAGALRQWLKVDQSSGLEGGDQTVGIQLSAKLATDGWGPVALGAFAAEIFRASALARCAFLAAPADEVLARSAWEQFGRATSAPDRAAIAISNDLSAWLGAIASLAALVTADTGGAHAGGMLGVGVVDLFEAARFEQQARRWRPWASASRCLIKPVWGPGVESAFGAEVGGAVREVCRR